MKALVLHPIGAPFVTNLIKALVENHDWVSLYTSFGLREGSKLKFNKLNRRKWIPDETQVVHDFPYYELLRILSTVIFNRIIPSRTTQRLVDYIYLDLDNRASNYLKDIRIDYIYGYEDCSYKTFKTAQKQGIKCIYDLPIPYYKELEEIYCRNEELFSKYNLDIKPLIEPTWKKDRKDNEIALSTNIFVASSYTKYSLTKHNVDESKITIIPYGIESSSDFYTKRSNERLKVLFSGRISPRKGVLHLLDALKSLGNVPIDLTLAGPLEIDRNFLSLPNINIRYIGRITKIDLDNLYKSSDLLIFPTLFDGFGMVILEAMSKGVPVITTENSAGPEIIRDGIDGFILKAGCSISIANKLSWCIDNRNELIHMGSSAQERAKEFTWLGYRKRIREIINSITK